MVKEGTRNERRKKRNGLVRECSKQKVIEKDRSRSDEGRIKEKKKQEEWEKKSGE